MKIKEQELSNKIWNIFELNKHQLKFSKSMKKNI